jgi:para-aminobenzoate synthetase component 1
MRGAWQALRWREPAEVFQALANAHRGALAFLFSSQPTGYSGRYSWLVWSELPSFVGTDWSALHSLQDSAAVADQAPPYVGWISYEMAAQLEVLPEVPEAFLSTSGFRFIVPTHALRFDHQLNKLDGWGDTVEDALLLTAPSCTMPAPRVASLASNMDRQAYLQIAQEAIESIRAGNFYQANLTRKFFGQLSEPTDPVTLFMRLQNASPAPYSAFMRFEDGLNILSSSPELFLRVTPDGQMETRPIKGTLARREHSALEAEHALLGSEKERAENLMIVDLMRNDLARVSIPGSIEAQKLFDLDHFHTVYHLSSTVRGQLDPSHSSLDALKAAFPPGSMIGAPKVAAMRWLSAKERMARGVYSGALGWMARDACEWSVVIRTLLLRDKAFEFQVGGGIVSDSLPEREWRETLVKARGIAAALGLAESSLEDI